MKNIKIPVEISAETIEDLLYTALYEGGSSWATTNDSSKHLKDLFDGGHITVIEYDDYSESTHLLDLDMVKKGLAALLKECPATLEEMNDDGWDSDTADLVLQYAIFGEQVYC